MKKDMWHEPPRERLGRLLEGWAYSLRFGATPRQLARRRLRKWGIIPRPPPPGKKAGVTLASCDAILKECYAPRIAAQDEEESLFWKSWDRYADFFDEDNS